ncbi:MAG: phage terminase large subunit, partial [Planctomycetota bacterium]
IGSGKSHVGCFWALLKALRNPHCLGLIGANSYQQLRDATLRTFEQTLRRCSVPYRFAKTDMEFHLANGATVLCRSLENVDFLRGIELGWFYLDELRDTRYEAWQVVKGRLRSRLADRLEGRVTSSPNGFDWIYREFVRKPADPATAEAYRTHEAFFARTADNHHLPPEYVAALVASYDARLAAQELDGRFVNVAAGRVYHAFDRRVHVTADAELDPSQPILWALDFNVTPMTAVIAQWEGRGDDGDDMGLRVVDEIWLTNAHTLMMCEAFEQWLEESVKGRVSRVKGSEADAIRSSALDTGHWTRPPLLVFGDAAGGARSTSGRSDYAIIRSVFPQAAIRVGASNPPRRDRYNAVNLALRDAAGRVRLRVHPRCGHLIDDLEQLVYQPGTAMPDVADPLAGHIADALGYLVARLLPAGPPVLGVGRW